MISDCPLLDGSITTDRNGISFCFVAKALCRTCPCQDSHVSISEWTGTLPEVNESPTSGAFIGSASRRLFSHLKHDFAWSVACGAVLKRFACAGQWKHLG